MPAGMSLWKRGTSAVSVTKEIRLLREAGIKTEIMVIAGIPFNNVNYVTEENLTTLGYNRE